jgi:hypothetical protein
MNNFIINVGVYVPFLKERAILTAEQIGKVNVDMGKTSCKVPYAPEYIKKAVQQEVKKRKTIRC